MNSNENQQLKIAHLLRQDPLLCDAAVTVAVNGRQATVSGTVDQFFKKALLLNLIRKATGIKNISDLTHVQLVNPERFNDTDIAAAIAEKLKVNFGTSFEHLRVIVKSGQVTLEGYLSWNYQKILASDCIQDVAGIVSIQNEIAIAAPPKPLVGEKDILAAIYKEESITSQISIAIAGRSVTISGEVPTSFQKKLVEKIVREMPGVETVEDRLQIVKKVASS